MSDTKTNKSKLREARLKNGCTMHEASSVVGISPSTLKKYEEDCGKVPAHTFVALFSYYNKKK